ncbi:MAG: nitroreductase family protein [Pseudomonadales bacterium]
MEVYDAMRTTFAARVYTDDPVSDATLHRILDHARFAPSGGNRQGWRVIVVKKPEIRRQLRDVMAPTIKRYKTQASAGETPFNTIHPSKVTEAAIDAMPADFPLVDDLDSAPVVLVVCVDLSVVSSFDSELPRVGVVSGASIYPFVWNILLAARNEGLGGVLTTFLANQEAQARAILKLPDHFAVASMIGIGKPVKQLTKLKRNPVADFARVDDWDGDVFTA